MPSDAMRHKIPFAAHNIQETKGEGGSQKDFPESSPGLLGALYQGVPIISGERGKSKGVGQRKVERATGEDAGRPRVPHFPGEGPPSRY